MPIFEYECEKCGYSWDELIKNKEKTDSICPKCSSKNISKKISNFSSGSGCSSSCAKSCSECHK